MKEVVAEFGAPEGLRGVASLPERTPPKDVGVLLLNAGVIHHVGPNRLWVHVGRACAARGMPALRFDFSGVGDSPPRADTLPFVPAAVAEARAGMDWLAEHHGVRRFALVGICSGAEIAFKTALEDPRATACILVNAPRFLAEPDPEIVRVLDQEVAADYTWRVSMGSMASWRRLLTGRADYRGLMRALGTRLGFKRRPSGVSCRDVEAFDALARRGVAVRVIVSEGDWGLRYLRLVLGRNLGDFERQGAIRVQVIPGADHLMTPAHAREQTSAGILDTLAALGV